MAGWLLDAAPAEDKKLSRMKAKQQGLTRAFRRQRQVLEQEPRARTAR